MSLKKRTHCSQSTSSDCSQLAQVLNAGNLGSSHHLIEDIALTRLFPNLSIYSPINEKNAKILLEKTYKENNPIYYRIGKNKTSLSDNIDCIETNIGLYLLVIII